MNTPDARNFCTCTDHQCPLNPVNHGRGCTLCVAKCLRAGEIPSCFFNAVNADERPESYTMEGFADFFIKHRGTRPSL